jgi:hypothetical protein
MPTVQEQSSPSDAAVDATTRELIALTAGVRERDAARIATRIAVLVRMGASRRDVQEALSAAVAKGGRRSLRFAIDALAAFDEQTSREAHLAA